MNNNKNNNKNTIYTRNLDPLMINTKLSNIVLYDQNEEEFDLHMCKKLKICVSIPTFKNNFYTNELKKLDVILKDFESVECFVISNEPVFTQSRLSRQCKFEKFNILSDFKKREYARMTGTYIYELSQLVKSVFIIDQNDKVLFVKYYDDLYSNIDANEIVSTINSI